MPPLFGLIEPHIFMKPYDSKMKRFLSHSDSHTDKHNIKYLGWVLYCCKIHKIGNICKLSKFLNILIFQEIILAKRGSNCSLEIWDFAVRVEVHHMLNNLNSKSILYHLMILLSQGACRKNSGELDFLDPSHIE